MKASRTIKKVSKITVGAFAVLFCIIAIRLELSGRLMRRGSAVTLIDGNVVENNVIYTNCEEDVLIYLDSLYWIDPVRKQISLINGSRIQRLPGGWGVWKTERLGGVLLSADSEKGGHDAKPIFGVKWVKFTDLNNRQVMIITP